MSTSTLGSSKSLNGKTVGIAAGAAIIVLGIVGWTAGWFGASTPADVQPAPAATTTTEQPAASTQGTAPAASQQQGTTTSP